MSATEQRFENDAQVERLLMEAEGDIAKRRRFAGIAAQMNEFFERGLGDRVDLAAMLPLSVEMLDYLIECGTRWAAEDVERVSDEWLEELLEMEGNRT